MVRQQLLHIFYATLIFAVIGAVAVGLDLASVWVGTLGVSEFTKLALYYASHTLLVLDLGLFALYLGKTSLDFVRALFS